MIKLKIEELDGQKILLINGEVFDWALDEEALIQANQYEKNKETMKAIHSDIRNYFLECIAEYLGFKPTIKQLYDGIQKGYIEDDNDT